MEVKFAKATINLDGPKPEAVITLINGNPEAGTTDYLNKNTTMADGSPLVHGDQVLVQLDKRNQVNPDRIYPFPSNQESQNLKGGIGKGVVTDANQDPYGGSTRIFVDDTSLDAAPAPEPIPKFMAIAPSWINGVDFEYLIMEIHLSSPAIFRVKDTVYFHCERIDEFNMRITDMVAAEGDAL